MEALRELLGQTDDEYLTGLCNKGTVKRAYKDLEQETPSVEWKENEAEVTLKETVCRIRMPLGESVCTCPSRSICRHVITAILYLKKLGEETEQGALKQTLEQELLSFPLQKLKRACGTKRYRDLLAYLKSGEQPEIQEASVITVRVPWEETVVKLLSPLKYSSCTCHSRELCPHKAQAVLLFQLHRNVVTLEQLGRMQESGEEWNLPEIARAADSVREGIRLQLMTGLSRLSSEAAESMERLAVISHGAGLALFETELRKMASEYRLYFERSAAFRTEELLEQLLALYQMADRLKKTEDSEEIQKLAGSFRDSYRPVPKLHLTAMGGRSFQSKTGYEGEIYYFLDSDTGRFYTWTDARPVFYEGVQRRAMGSGVQAPAPWGLGCNREQMMDLEFYLEHAKAAGGIRLSASQETKSEITGARDFRRDGIRRKVFWNYEKLLENCFEEMKQEKDGEHPVLVGAYRCREADFDTVQQRFSMDLTDPKGRRVTVAVAYSKEEKLTIQVLERLSERMKKEAGRPVVFLGLPYLEKGRLCLYPVEVFERERFFREPEELEQYLREGGELSEEMRETEPGSNPEKEIVQEMEQFLGEIRELLGDLFQSGLNSVQEELVENLWRLAGESGSLGLHGAQEDLAFLKKALEEKRHRMEFDPEPVLETLGRLMDYVRLCREKTSLDLAFCYIRKGEENNT